MPTPLIELPDRRRIALSEIERSREHRARYLKPSHGKAGDVLCLCRSEGIPMGVGHRSVPHDTYYLYPLHRSDPPRHALGCPHRIVEQQTGASGDAGGLPLVEIRGDRINLNLAAPLYRASSADGRKETDEEQKSDRQRAPAPRGAQHTVKQELGRRVLAYDVVLQVEGVLCVLGQPGADAQSLHPRIEQIESGLPLVARQWFAERAAERGFLWMCPCLGPRARHVVPRAGAAGHREHETQGGDRDALTAAKADTVPWFGGVQDAGRSRANQRDTRVAKGSRHTLQPGAHLLTSPAETFSARSRPAPAAR